MECKANDADIIDIKLSLSYQYRFSGCMVIDKAGIHKSTVLCIYLLDNLLLNIIGAHFCSPITHKPSRIEFHGGEISIFYESSIDILQLDSLYDHNYMYIFPESYEKNVYLNYIERLLKEITLHQECNNFLWYLTDPMRYSLEDKTKHLLNELAEMTSSSIVRISKMLDNYPYDSIIALINTLKEYQSD